MRVRPSFASGLAEIPIWTAKSLARPARLERAALEEPTAPTGVRPRCCHGCCQSCRQAPAGIDP
jgi:hypothetical protein